MCNAISPIGNGETYSVLLQNLQSFYGHELIKLPIKNISLAQAEIIRQNYQRMVKKMTYEITCNVHSLKKRTIRNFKGRKDKNSPFFELLHHSDF